MTKEEKMDGPESQKIGEKVEKMNEYPDRREEILYQSDDMVEFGDFRGYEGGSYRIRVYKEDNGEVYSYMQSYDEDGNEDEKESIIMDGCPDYEETARRIWRENRKR